LTGPPGDNRITLIKTKKGSGEVGRSIGKNKKKGLKSACEIHKVRTQRRPIGKGKTSLGKTTNLISSKTLDLS